MVTAGMLPRAAVREVEARLRAAGCPDADFDAAELFRLAAGGDARLADAPLGAEQAERLETLTAHADGCVGMAANMIGVLKRIIAVEAEDGYLVLFNPVILKKSGPYNTEEGCLSLEGVRPTRRWKSIKVQYETADGKPRIRTFTGWTAQIIQHEIDHCDGILI